MPEKIYTRFQELTKLIIRGRQISAEISIALKRIEKESENNFSEVIQYIDIAEKNFQDALVKLKDNQEHAIKEVDDKLRQEFSNQPKSPSRLPNHILKWLLGK
jgi:uncharacterized protein (DUF885 family)